MALEDIRRVLVAAIQKEIDLNVADTAKANQDYETQRAQIDVELKRLQAFQLALGEAQLTGQKLQEVLKNIEAILPEGEKDRAEWEAAEAKAAEAAATIELRR